MRKLLAAVVTLLLASCAHPGVASKLPLKRVVIYRNGVAYFERGGETSEKKVEFDVDPDHVSDFLATLSVMEKGGTSVRAAAFPMDSDEEVKPQPTTKDAAQGPQKPVRKTVAVELDGHWHDLRVGYVSSQPVWRPSYRLVFEDDRPTLQAWGIVQNVSGEDWKDVQMSLVAGAPIAFISNLATPVTPQRPQVTDNGEMIASVPVGETTIAQAPPPPPQATPPEAMGAIGGLGGGRGAMSGMAQPAPSMAPRPQKKAARKAELDQLQAPAMEGGYAEPSYSPIPAQQNLAMLAATQVQAGATRYDLPDTVTVPNQSATMVLLTSREVPGSQIFLYSPEGGVPDSSSHPFRVVNFTNGTGGLLERGPIAVFEKGAFLGQGLLEPLPDGAEATVPFALERGLAVSTNRRTEEKAARISKIEAGALTLERDQSVVTTYKAQNGLDKPGKLLIKHPRSSGYRIANAPKDTKDREGQSDALVPIEVPARGKADAVIDERRAYQLGMDWMSPYADEAVKAFLDDPKSDAKVAAQLRAAWKLREDLHQAQDDYRKVESQKQILNSAAEGTRQSLRSIERSRGVDDLRAKLLGRLSDLEGQILDLTQQSVKLQLKANELQVRFLEAVKEIRFEAPPTT